MKKFLLIAGILVLVVGTAFAAVKIYQHHQASQYEATAVPYLKMVVPELSTWNPETIKRYMPPESLEGTSEEKLNGIVDYLSRLGKLEKMEEPEFSQTDSMGKKFGEKMVITYKINAHYEKGDALIMIGLLEGGGSYHVQNFNIHSDVLE